MRTRLAKAEKSLAKRDAALLKQKREFEAEQEGHRGEQRSTRIALAEETHRMEQLRLDEQVAFQRELQQLQVKSLNNIQCVARNMYTEK